MLFRSDEVKQEAGFWSIFHINQLLERMRALLPGGRSGAIKGGQPADERHDG